MLHPLTEASRAASLSRRSRYTYFDDLLISAAPVALPEECKYVDPSSNALSGRCFRSVNVTCVTITAQASPGISACFFDPRVQNGDTLEKGSLKLEWMVVWGG